MLVQCQERISNYQSINSAQLLRVSTLNDQSFALTRAFSSKKSDMMEYHFHERFSQYLSHVWKTQIHIYTCRYSPRNAHTHKHPLSLSSAASPSCPYSMRIDKTNLKITCTFLSVSSQYFLSEWSKCE